MNKRFKKECTYGRKTGHYMRYQDPSRLSFGRNENEVQRMNNEVVELGDTVLDTLEKGFYVKPESRELVAKLVATRNEYRDGMYKIVAAQKILEENYEDGIRKVEMTQEEFGVYVRAVVAGEKKRLGK